MDGIKHSRQFAEMERLVSDYFHCHLAPVMSKTQAYLTKKQGEEMREYSTSLGGILSAMASAAQPMGDPYQVLKVTGEWNSKTTEDYIGMCKAGIVRCCLRYNTIPQIQKACAFSTFVGQEITCFILFYCFRYLSGNFQRALNAVDQVAEQPNDHAALAP